jgi:hypothetical protein
LIGSSRSEDSVGAEEQRPVFANPPGYSAALEKERDALSLAVGCGIEVQELRLRWI